MSNIIAIVGRPNVGKSTLFNRLLEKKKAIIDNQSGVTRDRHYGQVHWIGHNFTVIDTGGYVKGSSDKFEAEIRKQVEMAIDESTLVLFMVDCQTGITGLDQDFANVVRSAGKPVLIVANKADNPDLLLNSSEFFNLGIDGDIFPVSSVSGSGTGDLLDKVVTYLENDIVSDDDNLPKISIVGRPNAGKSSFLNALLGTERSIVTEEAGTTRDSINTRYTLFGKDFIITDTAGVRKKAKVHDDIEFYAVLRAIHSLQDCDVAIIMVDATRGFEAQDMNLLGLAKRNNKGAVVMINKWDLMEKESNTARDFEKEIREKIAPMDYVPILFTSVISKQRIFKVVEKALEVWDNLQLRISTSELNDKIGKEIEHYPPPSVKGKHIKIKYITQLHSNSPTFAFFCNLPQYIKPPYQRFLEGKLRKHFGFEGVPLRVYFRKK